MADRQVLFTGLHGSNSSEWGALAEGTPTTILGVYCKVCAAYLIRWERPLASFVSISQVRQLRLRRSDTQLANKAEIESQVWRLCALALCARFPKSTPASGHFWGIGKKQVAAVLSTSRKVRAKTGSRLWARAGLLDPKPGPEGTLPAPIPGIFTSQG